ncbi:hypothetical protein [Bacillus sp. SKDU12]
MRVVVARQPFLIEKNRLLLMNWYIEQAKKMYIALRTAIRQLQI